MTRTLKIVFNDAVGGKGFINLASPKENLTLAEVQPVAEAIVQDKVFANKQGIFVAFEKGMIITRTIEELK